MYSNVAIAHHDMPDDFASQPSGNSGTKIACGKITKLSQFGYINSQVIFVFQQY